MKKTFGRILILSFCIITMLSCVEKPESAPDNQEILAVVDTTTIDVSKKLKPALRLTQKAQDSSKKWITYSGLEDILPGTKITTIGKLRSSIERAVALFEQKEQGEDENIPAFAEAKQPPAINARMLVIETKIRLLNDLVSKEIPDIKYIEKELVELHNAYQNLRLQINERYAKSIEDMLEELREQEQQQEENQLTPQDRPPLIISEN